MVCSDGKEHGRRPRPKHGHKLETLQSGRSRSRTCDPCRVKPDIGVINGYQDVSTQRNHSKAGGRDSQALGDIPTVLSQFGPPVVQGRTAVEGVSGAPARLLRVKEVAAFLGVSTATVYRLCEEGALPHVRVSNSIRISLAALGSLGQ